MKKISTLVIIAFAVILLTGCPPPPDKEKFTLHGFIGFTNECYMKQDYTKNVIVTLIVADSNKKDIDTFKIASQPVNKNFDYTFETDKPAKKWKIYSVTDTDDKKISLCPYSCKSPFMDSTDACYQQIFINGKENNFFFSTEYYSISDTIKIEYVCSCKDPKYKIKKKE